MTLCEDCRNGTVLLCNFMRAKPGDMEDTILRMGLQVERKFVYDRNRNSSKDQYPVYSVVSCPKYKPGQIPPIGRYYKNTEINKTKELQCCAQQL